jgi:AcrR family transcriptional regulator
MSAPSRIRYNAEELFSSRGYHGTGIRDLAAASGVSIATLYHHFGTKEKLLLDLMIGGLDTLTSNADYALREVHGPVERLGTLTVLHVLTHGMTQKLSVVVDTELRALSPEGRETVTNRRDQYERLWEEQLEEGVRLGVMTLENARVTRLALLRMCTSVAYWYSKGGELSLHEVALQHGNIVLNSVRAQVGSEHARLVDLAIPDINTLHGVAESSVARNWPQASAL